MKLIFLLNNSIIKINYLNIVNISDLHNLKIYTIIDICSVVFDFTEVVENNIRNDTTFEEYNFGWHLKI